jgi:hypothetical protein
MKRAVSRKLVLRAAGVVVITTALTLVGAAARGMFAAGAGRVNTQLAATGAASSASGRASLNLRAATKGRFMLWARHLRSGGSYDVIVGGVKVGAIQTNRIGSGLASFSTTPRGKTALLGFDPRGSTLLVRDSSTGTDDLVGSIPDDNPGAGACCLTNSHGEVECEDLSPTDCTTAGGTTPMITNPDGSQIPVTSCLPDPCGSTQPPSTSTVCCINSTHDDGTETECEDDAESDCATRGGTMVQAPSCDPNPCQPAPPVNVSACCKQDSGDSSETECEVMSGDACIADGGTPNAATSCDPNPCPAPTPAPGTSACCIPQTGDDSTEALECEDLSADACTQAGGSPPANGSTSCDPNPCP